MGLPKQTIEAVGAAEVKTAAGAEVVVVTLPGISTTLLNGRVFLEAVVPFTSAAEATTQTITIRREGLTGTVVAELLIKAGASAEDEITLNAEDAPGEVSGLSYVVTLKGAAAKELIAKRARLQAQF